MVPCIARLWLWPILAWATVVLSTDEIITVEVTSDEALSRLIRSFQGYGAWQCHDFRGSMLNARQPQLRVRHELRGSIFKGLTLQHDSNGGVSGSSAAVNALRCLEEMPDVIRVWTSPAASYSIIGAEEGFMDDELSMPAFNKPSRNGKRENIATRRGAPMLVDNMSNVDLSVAESSAQNAATAVFAAHSVHRMTGVDELHRRNITGQGIKIALIDSGLDYRHAGLGGGFGPGFKVSGGYDFVGDAWERGLPANPSEDPYTECSFHGTHTSGIAAGHDPRTGYTGAAPGANILHYRIIGCDTRNTLLDSDIIARAILKAYDDGADVISISLSMSKGPYPDDPVSEIITRITDEGRTVCVVAAGNNGPNGTFTADAPASAKGVLSVGTVNGLRTIQSRPRARMYLVSHVPPNNPAVTGSNNITAEFMWTPATPKGRFPETIKLQPLVSITGRDDETACNAFIGNTTVPSSAVILVRRGNCSFAEKLRNVAAAGGRYVLVYDDHTLEKPDGLSHSMDQLPEFDSNIDGIEGAGFVSAETGETWLSFITSAAQTHDGGYFSLNMDSNLTLTPYFTSKSPSLAPGRVNGRSTWGPSGDGRILPLLVSPGGNMMSTLPRSWGGYGVLSGSSMATPYAAGCVALLKQARPELKAHEIVNLLASTAKPVEFSDGTDHSYGFLAPVWHQGGGLINPLAAVETAIIPSVPHLSFNDTEHFEEIKTFEVQNAEHEDVWYELSVSSPWANTKLDGNLANFGLAAATVMSRYPDPERGFVPWGWESSVAEKSFSETVRGPKDHPDLQPTVDVEPKVLKLHPGQSATVSVHVKSLNSLASGSISSRCPLWGGYVAIQSSAKNVGSGDPPKRHPTHYLAYGGIACPLGGIVVLANHSDADQRTMAEVSESQDNKELPGFSLAMNRQWQGTFLTAATRADQYSPKFVAELVPPMKTFALPRPWRQSAVIGYQGLDSPASKSHLPLLPTLNLKFDLSTRAVAIDVLMPSNESGYVTLGPAFGPEVTRRAGGFNRSNTVYQPWSGQLANGTWVQEGIYAFRVCALKTWGDFDNPRDYRDCVTTVPFQLTYDGEERSKDLSSDMGRCGFFDERPGYGRDSGRQKSLIGRK